MCAKTSLAYQSVASLARELGELDYSDHLSQLARNIKENMNQSIEEGGLWKAQADGGYYVQMRKIGEQDSIHDQFIPYNNLVPMWCGMTSSSQDQAIFNRLDATFEDIYMLDFGPMYCAPAGEHEKSVMDCSSVTWLAFLDIHLRGIKGHQKNRDRIFKLLMKHAGDVDNIPFPEGAGVYGYLTGGAGRSWDNGTFFHMLITGVYGISKHKDGITISDPNPIKEQPLTELKNVIWRDATYDFIWSGKGNQIKNIRMNNKEINAENETYLLHAASGHHRVEIALSE